MNNLSQMKCLPCRKGDPPLTDGEIANLHPQVPGWQVIEVDGIKRLQHVFKFNSYPEALDFTNKVASIAEEQDHHPLIILEWGRVTIQWWTHVVKGLHQNDFIMASKVDVINSE